MKRSMEIGPYVGEDHSPARKMAASRYVANARRYSRSIQKESLKWKGWCRRGKRISMKSAVYRHKKEGIYPNSKRYEAIAWADYPGWSKGLKPLGIKKQKDPGASEERWNGKPISQALIKPLAKLFKIKKRGLTKNQLILSCSGMPKAGHEEES